MTVSLVLILVMGVLFAAGVYAMLERSLTRVLIGFLLLGNAANLFLLVVMGRPGVAPFFGSAEPAEMSDPLPQALTLTAIVITFAISAFLLALIYRSWQLGQADTVEDDATDLAVRTRGAAEEDVMDDEAEDFGDDVTTDFGIDDDGAPVSASGRTVEADAAATRTAQGTRLGDPRRSGDPRRRSGATGRPGDTGPSGDAKPRPKGKGR